MDLNLSNINESYKSEIEFLYLRNRESHCDKLLKRIHEIHKMQIADKNFSEISFTMSLTAHAIYTGSKSEYQQVMSMLSEAKFLALNENDKPGIAIADLYKGMIQYEEGYTKEALSVLSKVKRADLPFDCMQNDLDSLLDKAKKQCQLDVEQEDPYTAILKVARTLSAETNIDKLLQIVVEEVKKVLNADRCTVFLLDEDKEMLCSKVALGLDSKEIRIPINTGIAGYVATTGKTINIKDAYKDSRFNKDVDLETGYKTKSIICIPIWNLNHEILGAFQVLNKLTGKFTQKDQDILLALSASLGIAIENARLFENQQKMIETQRQLFCSFIDTLSASIDARDKITAGHSSRVRMYSELISDIMNLPQPEKDNISHAAILHDIGKIGIKDSVLQKEGKLTDEEFSHIQQHVKMTYDILNKIYLNDEFKDVAEIASSHHEKYNGSGYFRNLKHNQIPLGGRILAVGDVFDAITSKRHYRDKMPVKQALDIIKNGAGSHFDPIVVNAFFKIKTDKLVSVFLSEINSILDLDAKKVLENYTVEYLYDLLSKESCDGISDEDKRFISLFDKYYNCKAGT